MKLNLPILAAAALLPLTASAATTVDLALYLGGSFPGYSQTFTYDPGPVTLTVPIPGLVITQSGGFTFEGSGGLVLSGGVTVYFGGVVGIEGRYDTVRVHVNETAPSYGVSVTLPGVPQPVTASLDLGLGIVDVSTLKPWSLNLKLRTPGSGVRFFASGGISHLPSFDFTVSQRIGLGVTGVNLITRQATIASVGISGALTPVAGPDAGTSPGSGASKWGGNLGGGLQFSVSKNITVVAEARYFYFPSQKYEWTVKEDRLLSSIEQALLNATLGRAQQVEFKPRFFQVTGGVTIGF
jgi:opacity protein-like surface antigen